MEDKETESLVGSIGDINVPRFSDSTEKDVDDVMQQSTDFTTIQDYDGRTSTCKTLMNLMKGNIGPGILALPIAFKYAGLWAGAVGLLILGYISLHCQHMLMNCSDILKDRTMCASIGYAGIVENCLATGPVFFRRFQRVGRIVINGFLIITQLGFCCVYIVFVAQNFRQVILSSNEPNPNMDKVIMGTEVAVLIIYCVFAQSLAALAYFSLVANALNFAGLVLVFYYVMQHPPEQSQREAFVGWTSLPLYFGTTVYAFEGIGLVMPLKNKARDEQNFSRRCGVLTLGMTIVIALYTGVGFLGYLKYGDFVKGSITLNLPAKELLSRLTKIAFVVSVFVTYGLQFYVPVNIIWPRIEDHLSSERSKTIGNICFRISLIILTCAIALVIPHLDLLIALIGALASSSLALIFPPVLEILTLSADGEHISCITIVKDLAILCLGILGCITGSYAAIEGIIKVLQK